MTIPEKTEKTIREMVRDVQKEVRDTPDLSPGRAAALEARLSGLHGSILTELTAAEIAYKRELLRCLRENEKANRARIEAETSAEYERFREARDVRDSCVEMIRTLRQYLRNAAEEMRLTR